MTAINVIKVGGSILEPAPTPALLAALSQLGRGQKLVLVHGGGKTLTALQARLGQKSEFRAGLRVTDPAVLAAAVMAFAGTVNTSLVTALQGAGFRAVGLTGADAAGITAAPVPELGAVGNVTAVQPDLLRTLLDAGYTPVLASLALGPDGGLLNVNADQFAAAVAAALGAERLLFLTDVDGVWDAAGQPLRLASLDELRALALSGALRGGMLPKAEACGAALAAGVRRVEII
ncbi:MAG: acetylglutamate kinase, partial [Terriglobales bacterium]